MQQLCWNFGGPMLPLLLWRCTAPAKTLVACCNGARRPHWTCLMHFRRVACGRIARSHQWLLSPTAACAGTACHLLACEPELNLHRRDGAPNSICMSSSCCWLVGWLVGVYVAVSGAVRMLCSLAQPGSALWFPLLSLEVPSGGVGVVAAGPGPWLHGWLQWW